MSEILELILNYGVLGVACIALVIAVKILYKRNCVMSDKLTVIIEHNTEAMVELKQVIERHK